jgi:hypothetical protein
MSDGRDFLPPDVKSLVDAERNRFAIPDDARVRLASKLALAVPAFGHGAGGSAPPGGSVASGASGASGASTLLGSAGAKLLVVLSVVSAGAVGMQLRSARSAVTSAPPSRTLIVAPVVQHAPVPPAASAESALPPPVNVPTPSPPSTVHAAVAVPTHAEVSSPELAEERLLLDAARASIVRGAAEEALPLLASHAARFPSGALSEERLALQIRALSRLGRADEARGLLATLASRYPHSFLLKGATDDVGLLR